jgi:NosR/NirI family nitrous oxide reductase transcriptional regulator
MGMDSRLPIFRKITQVLSLIFCVGLFVLGFNEFQSVRPLLINHNYSLPNPWLFKTLLAVVLILGLFFGNFFCGWFCAFGTVNDFLNRY